MQNHYSQACENNKKAILDVISPYFKECSHILEIGSGTGQHAVFFANNMPWLQWQTSDLQENHPSIVSWLSEMGLDNLHFPIALNVFSNKWPTDCFDGVFSANTAHIMAWSEVQAMFHRIGELLPSGGVFCLYGPFNYQGQFTSLSNAYFDQHLKQRASRMGIRDFESVIAEADSQGLLLLTDYEMPANNRTLIWQKQ